MVGNGSIVATRADEFRWNLILVLFPACSVVEMYGTWFVVSMIREP